MSGISGFPCFHVLSKLFCLVLCVNNGLQEDHFAFGVEHVGKDMNMFVHGFQAASKLSVVARSLCNIVIDAPAVIWVTQFWISQDHRDGPGTKMMPIVHSAERYHAQIFVGLGMYFGRDQLTTGQFCSFPEF